MEMLTLPHPEAIITGKQQKITTADIEAALRAAGVEVTAIELGRAREPDIIRLSVDDYLVIDHEEAERAGTVSVSLNEAMHSGGDPTYADWTLPPSSLDEIVEYLQDAE